ncbi:NUDIX hydrolase [Plantactinospora sp. KLBMP9567]|uniref:NUDIX hydrolase n=1 Tax=Plantactinospora sp. KLBMP9567 TaxID=3085900 RepID=UPI0029821681|nr:NUDIX hydrolase [Plantactinospora sp. KLBMP9567]MDW5330813.1 NUDIX hydrolase [Plantactinospora sp. KLBMP9567]
MTASQQPPMATPRVAAGALFFDAAGRVLLVRPSYKQGWEIPGGYVQLGESPRAACIREVQEELGLTVDVGALLVIDWAPAANEGDKLLFVFDAGPLDGDRQRRIAFTDGEITEWRFVGVEDLDDYGPDRLIRRIRTAIAARTRGRTIYAEHGVMAGPQPEPLPQP